ncbi:MAG: septation protein SpoVG family protein [Candidatus Omnitrophica bacterium]|nr:septation protein SpoVG family protein [Candidatus Omnitrophota bacterium]
MNKLEISEIQIVPIRAQNGLVAFASCVINKQFYIGNIAIHSTFSEDEFRLVYPTRVLANNRATSCVHPINKETGDAMRFAICKAFKELFIKYSDKQLNFI